MAEDGIEVAGFYFDTRKEADEASLEIEKKAYMDAKLNYENPESVLYVYNKAVENRIFHTPVGLDYLRKVRGFLVREGLEDQALMVPRYENKRASFNEDIQKLTGKVRVAPSAYRSLKKKLRISLIFNIILVLLVIAMFMITLNSENPNILNYEKVLTDKYASWEQDLSERESIIRERERAVGLDGD